MPFPSQPSSRRNNETSGAFTYSSRQEFLATTPGNHRDTVITSADDSATVFEFDRCIACIIIDSFVLRFDEVLRDSKIYVGFDR